MITEILKTFRRRFASKLYMDQNGFTLIEMMIAMAISLLVLSGVYEVFTSQQKAYTIQDQVAEMQQNARVAMDIMTREIKMAGYIAEQWFGGMAPSVDISYNPPNIGNGTPEDIEENGANAITFEADVDGDGITETVRYSIDTTNAELEREVWKLNGAAWDASGGAQPIAENITSLIFTYDNVTRANIRLIQISITARTAREDSGYTHPTEGDGYRRRTLTAYVRPRNLGL